MTPSLVDSAQRSILAVLTEAGTGPVTEVNETLHGPSVAVFSADRTYRYLLTRRWAPGPTLTWLMLNPSTADAFKDDPTVHRCWRRAVLRQWRGIEFGAIAVVNLFALRATDPAELRTHPDPVGPGNDACLRVFCRPGDTVVAAWGAHGALNGRAAQVTRMLTEAGAQLLCLGTTASGQPRHPGRLAYAEPITPWAPVSVSAAPQRVKVEGDLFHGLVPTGAIYVGRAAPKLPASPYANPYPVRTHGLAEALRLYREHLAQHPGLVAQARRELAGRNLACWCPLSHECHADVLLVAVNENGLRKPKGDHSDA